MKKSGNYLILILLMLACFSINVSASDHEGHDVEKWDSYYEHDNTYHEVTYYCNDCYTFFEVLEPHKWEFYDTQQNDEYSHDVIYRCKDCYNYSTLGTAPHTFAWQDNGCGPEYNCTSCYYTQFNASLLGSYGYKNSTKLNICLWDSCAPGDVVIVKLNGKTYKKTIYEYCCNPDIYLKIKKPKKNYKYSIYIVHAGRQIYLGSDYIKTSSNPKKGMTKKQVAKYTDWGYPTSTSYSSRGYTYWIYKDGSYVVFKKGKVKYWRSY